MNFKRWKDWPVLVWVRKIQNFRLFLYWSALMCTLFWLLPFAVRSHPLPSTKPASKTAKYGASARSEEAFRRLLKEHWEYSLREEPLFASMIGDRRYDHLLPDVSMAAQLRRKRSLETFLRKLREIPVATLGEASRLNYALFQSMVATDAKKLAFRDYLIPITNREGFHMDFADLPNHTAFRKVSNYRAFLGRLQGFQRYVAQHIELMREGLRVGATLPQIVLQGYDKTIRPHVVKEPTQSLLYAPFRKFAKGIPVAQHAALRRAAVEAIRTSVVPGYRAFLQFMTKEYIPAARKSIGAKALPNGKAFYRFCVSHHTTLPISPDAVHLKGWQEVKRIRKEMQTVIQNVGFKGDFAAFLKFLRTDPRFYVQTKTQLLQATSYVLKRMDGQLPRLFGHLPRMPYGIREIPSYIAPKTSTAYYYPPSGDGRKAGFYYVNTYNLKSRPLYEIPALSFHEAVPGHHLQIAIQQELKGLPPFRRFYRAMAFQEGWALYAERLGLEVGFYRDPYENFGRLTYEMWRACRLVVDTGIHLMGWSRRKAIQFMAENTALSMHNIEAEVDRYIAWPGQALAYKMGELKIRELRQRAEKALGARFDLRAFHDRVLSQGAIPMDLLEKRMLEWIKARK